MNRLRLMKIICICLLLLILISPICARNRYDWELEDLREEDEAVTRASGSKFGLYFGLLSLWVAIAMLVAFGCRREACKAKAWKS